MLKLKKGTKEYEVIGLITFKPDEESPEQTNYTIVIDGVTTTIESTDTKWEVIDVPDPEPVIEEPVVEPIPPAPEPVIIEPTPEELAEQEAQRARNEWHQKRSALATMIDDMEKGKLLGMEPTPEQMAIMTSLAQWVNANMKQEYYF